MNKRLIIASLLTLSSALFVNQSVAAVPPVDKVGVPAYTICKPKVNSSGIPTLDQPVHHFDKIIFKITSTLQAASGTPADQTSLNNLPRNTELDIKVVDRPATIADLKLKVLSFLGAVASPNFYPAITIVDVEYAVVICPK